MRFVLSIRRTSCQCLLFIQSLQFRTLFFHISEDSALSIISLCFIEICSIPPICLPCDTKHVVVFDILHVLLQIHITLL